jgi:hypothetical protein
MVTNPEYDDNLNNDKDEEEQKPLPDPDPDLDERIVKRDDKKKGERK